MLLPVTSGADQDKSVKRYYETVKGTLVYKFQQSLYYTVLTRVHRKIQAAVENEEETNFWGKKGEWKSLDKVHLGEKAIVLSCKEDILADFYDVRNIQSSKFTDEIYCEFYSRYNAWVKAFAVLAGSESQKERDYAWDQLTDKGKLLKQRFFFHALGTHVKKRTGLCVQQTPLHVQGRRQM